MKKNVILSVLLVSLLALAVIYHKPLIYSYHSAVVKPMIASNTVTSYQHTWHAQYLYKTNYLKTGQFQILTDCDESTMKQHVLQYAHPECLSAWIVKSGRNGLSNYIIHFALPHGHDNSLIQHMSKIGTVHYSYHP